MIIPQYDRIYISENLVNQVLFGYQVRQGAFHRKGIKNAREIGRFYVYLMSGLCPETHLRNFFEKKLLKNLQKALPDSGLGALSIV